MFTLVIYDIPDDKVRHRVSETCLDYGLTRIQYSAFRGILTHNRQQELLQRVKRVVGQKQGNIQLYTLCQKCAALKKELSLGGYSLASSLAQRMTKHPATNKK